MMEEAPPDDLVQWATFSAFDFNQIAPVREESSDQWPPPCVDQETTIAQLHSRKSSYDTDSFRQQSIDESLVDVSDEARDEGVYGDSERLLEMEQEQDMLNASLISLTTHFAQVQFRLKQISAADDIETKEKLIKDLELFAFEGCPDVRGVVPKAKADLLPDEVNHEENHQKQVVETKELIQRLQKQLTDVEQWAYDSGEAEPPSLAVLERQKLILDTLRERVKLSVDGYERLPPEELRVKIDEAIEAIISPYRRKELAQERTVSNMQTLLDDMERYIGHLNQPGATKASAVPDKTTPLTPPSKSVGGSKEPVDPRSVSSRHLGSGYVTSLIHRTYNVLQVFAFMNWACVGDQRFHKNQMKSTIKGNHWGDVRAALEISISRVADAARTHQVGRSRHRWRHPSYQDLVAVSEDNLTKLVRKDLANAIANVMKHGLIHLSSETSLVPRMMCTSRRLEEPKEMHPWEFLLKYYAYKNGNQFNRSATKKLSESFQLSSVGETAITPQQTLLSTIGEIIDSHDKFKRSPMTHLKAFVCAGLNQKSLSMWLRLIYCTKPVIDEYYMPWSYAAKTHFEDACRSLDSLSAFPFALPADLAVRPFSNLNEAF
ncbi:RUN domain-containing protein 1 [Hypsibius exemplaris]|uniref:RUN domain-containing protein 1 n=1 Tax=Hypsibius exemplaris TaxID=2072580 RepID=A0A1W0X705_HYPEX|nr:RUN domain-containing protein 1 [Hypsibius exemplaris]